MPTKSALSYNWIKITDTWREYLRTFMRLIFPKEALFSLRYELRPVQQLTIWIPLIILDKYPKTLGDLREKFNQYDVSTFTRWVKHRNSWRSKHILSYQKYKALIVCELKRRYSRIISGTITKRTRRMCYALRTSPNLFIHIFALPSARMYVASRLLLSTDLSQYWKWRWNLPLQFTSKFIMELC